MDGFFALDKGSVEDYDQGETGSRLLAAGMHHVFFSLYKIRKKENVLVLVLCDLLIDHFAIVDGIQRADDVHG